MASPNNWNIPQGSTCCLCQRRPCVLTISKQYVLNISCRSYCRKENPDFSPILCELQKVHLGQVFVTVVLGTYCLLVCMNLVSSSCMICLPSAIKPGVSSSNYHWCSPVYSVCFNILKTHLMIDSLILKSQYGAWKSWNNLEFHQRCFQVLALNYVLLVLEMPGILASHMNLFIILIFIANISS
jgi:hypothetical protein